MVKKQTPRSAVDEPKTAVPRTFKLYILMVQVFGYLPICGYFREDVDALRFSWTSFRTIYSLLTLTGLAFISSVQAVRLFIYPVKILDIHRFIYFLRALASSIYFISMARHWRRYMKTWVKVDEAMKHYGSSYKSEKRAKILIFILTVLFIVDFILINIHRIKDEILTGSLEFNLESWNHLIRDLKYPYIYQIFQYDIASGIVLMIVQTQFQIAATYMDIFIIINSILLTERVSKVSDRIEELSQDMMASEEQWMEVREDYNRLECHCKIVNSELGYAYLISFAGNLGGVLIQLYNTLNFKATIIGLTYLYYSFGFVLTRILCVCFFGSNVNEQAKRSLMFLYRAPNSAYYTEIDRLIRQISRQNLTLNGLNFFQIKRNLILQIAGSIVTYELVLVQFAGEVIKDDSTLKNKTNSL